MAEPTYPVMTTRRIGKTVTEKKLGKIPSKQLAKFAAEYVQQLVKDADVYVTEQGRSQILESDVEFVKKNFKGY
jgi:histone H3/H4